MRKLSSIILPVLIFVLTACGETTFPATTEPAPFSQPGSPPEQENSPTANPTIQPGTVTQPTASTPADLRVIYLREGNLWSWTQAGGSVQLTGTGDMSAARLSGDGQTLTFMRGRDVWTVNMDGTGARLLATQVDEGGALWFAPGGKDLAVTTRDHIDLIDFDTAGLSTVLTYPNIPGGYYPEVVWSPDASGLKTIIPPQTENGQAEFLFVFRDGTQASLAKFALAPLAESAPFISPDGGYVIYVAKAGDGKESLYLMDSSGATKSYGESATHVRALGWQPDGKHFAFSIGEPARAFLGDVAGPPAEINLGHFDSFRWMNGEQFVGLWGGNLYFGDIHGGQTLIDEQVSAFDF